MSGPIYVHRLVALDEQPTRILVRPEAHHTVKAGLNHVDRLTDRAIRAMEILLQPVAKEERSGVGVVISTAAGCLEVDRIFDRTRRENPRFASPASFSRTLPSTVLAELSLCFGLTGPSLTASCAETPFALAVYRATRWLEAFDLPYCVAGIVDHLAKGFENPHDQHLITDVEGACFVQFWLLSRQPSADALGAFTVSMRSLEAGDHDVNGSAPDLDAAWLLTPPGDYVNSQLHFRRCVPAGDR